MVLLQHLFIGGFKLLVLPTLQNLGSRCGGFSAQEISPLSLFALTAAILYGLWSVRWSQQEQSAR